MARRRSLVPLRRAARIKAVNMRIKGYSLNDIRRECGFSSVNQARAAISREIAAQKEENLRAELLFIENNRLEYLWQQTADTIEDAYDQTTKLQALHVGLKISQRRSAFSGLDSTPEEAGHSAVDDWINDLTTPSVEEVMYEDEPEDLIDYQGEEDPDLEEEF